MKVQEAVVKSMIYKLIVDGENYRTEILSLIDAEFLQYIVDFFKRIVDIKLSGKQVTPNWYKEELLNSNLPKNEIAINSGLNMKSISNVYNSATKEVVIEASEEHYDALYNLIDKMVKDDEGINIKLTIKFKDVSVDLNINESLIVINALAVKRAALRGGLWSTAGKQVEKRLMRTLCILHRVPEEHYSSNTTSMPSNYFIKNKNKNFSREIDFYLMSHKLKEICKCEVKLMGRGNPESADAVIARGSRVFVGDKLSDLNKKQLTSLNVEWVCLSDKEGYKRFYTLLKNLKIPCTEFTGNIKTQLKKVLKRI